MGRRTRRAHRLTNRLNWPAPVLSRTLDVASPWYPNQPCYHIFRRLRYLIEMAHARNGSKPARNNVQEKLIPGRAEFFAPPSRAHPVRGTSHLSPITPHLIVPRSLVSMNVMSERGTIR